MTKINKEIRKEIIIELSGLPNQEFRPGALVSSVGTKWVKWTDRSNYYKASLRDFYKALMDKNENIYQIINDN